MAKRRKNQTMSEIIGNSGHKDKLRVGWDGKAPEVDTKLVTDNFLAVNDANDLKREAEIKKYNQEIKNLNPLYSNMIPVTKVLVRCFHIETERTESGLIVTPTKALVKLPTRAGVGFKGTAESPYLYTRKAVIVSVPERYMNDENGKIKPGVIVQLENPALQAIPTGRNSTGGEEFDIDMPNAFTHYSYQGITPPIDPEDDHFGYLLVSVTDIQMILDE